MCILKNKQIDGYRYLYLNTDKTEIYDLGFLPW